MKAEAIHPLRRIERNRKTLKALIWLYFFLLIFEGALRMLLPPISTPLLIVRDPVVLVIFVFAQIGFVFPWNRFMLLFWLLGLIAMLLGIFVIPGALSVLAYGFRCSFLHVPLIFIIAKVMDEQDVIAMGRWFLMLAVPIAILMAVQFAVGGDHWLNRGLENQFTQLGVTAEKIRPPGTFTSITGPVAFYAVVAAFLLYGQFVPGTYSARLTFAAAMATALALSVSMSRAALFSTAVVILTSAVGVALARPQQAVKFVRFALLGALAFFAISRLPVFDESSTIFANRITGATNEEGGPIGLAMRMLAAFVPIETAVGTAIEGAGLGRGTNAGSVMMAGQIVALREYEWHRVVFELGAPLGVLYILMRIALSIQVLKTSYLTARAGLMLPMMLVGTCWINVLTGGWHQTTSLGFSILGAGICLAAANRRTPLASVAAP